MCSSTERHLSAQGCCSSSLKVSLNEALKEIQFFNQVDMSENHATAAVTLQLKSVQRIPIGK